MRFYFADVDDFSIYNMDVLSKALEEANIDINGTFNLKHIFF